MSTSDQWSLRLESLITVKKYISWHHISIPELIRSYDLEEAPPFTIWCDMFFDIQGVF
jgi:hypothetical protein